MAFVALGCVALRNASDIWASAMLGLVVIVFSTAILLAVFRVDARRAFWIGFSTFGWLYLLMLAYGWNLNPIFGGDVPLLANNLATSRISSACHEWLYEEAFQRYHNSQQQPMGSRPGGMIGSGMGGPGLMLGDGGSGMKAGGAGSAVAGLGGGFMSPSAPPPGPAQQDFANVAHSLWAIVLAMLGGWLAVVISRTSRPKQANPHGGRAD